MTNETERERDLKRIDEIFAELPRCLQMNDGQRFRELEEEMQGLRNKYPEESDGK